MYNPDNYLAPGMETHFVCKQIASSSFIKGTVFIFPTLLSGFKFPITNRDRVPTSHTMGSVTHSSCPLYSFTLISAEQKT